MKIQHHGERKSNYKDKARHSVSDLNPCYKGGGNKSEAAACKHSVAGLGCAKFGFEVSVY